MDKKRILHTFGLGVVAGLAWLAVHLKDSPYWWAPAGAALAAALTVQLPKVAPSIFGPLVFLVVFGAAGAGCWLTKPPPVSPNVPDGGFADASAGTVFVDCSDAALHNAALKLLPAVETGLATGNLEAALATVGVSLGAPLVVDEVSCAVAWVVARVSHSEAADPIENTKLVNGTAWLASRPQLRVVNAGVP